MNAKIKKIGLGGSCHWCTEAIFLSLIGVVEVKQGWLSSFNDNDWLSEGVVVYFDPNKITLELLIEVHLYTHSSTSNHSMRNKYRSAVYCESTKQIQQVEEILNQLQLSFNKPIVTAAYLLNQFELSPEKYQNYYYSDPEKPFCKTVINPKLSILLENFAEKVNPERVDDSPSDKVK